MQSAGDLGGARNSRSILSDMSSLGKTLRRSSNSAITCRRSSIDKHSIGFAPRCGVKMLIQTFSVAGFSDQNARNSRRYPGRWTIALVMVQ